MDALSFQPISKRTAYLGDWRSRHLSQGLGETLETLGTLFYEPEVCAAVYSVTHQDRELVNSMSEIEILGTWVDGD